MQWNNRSYKGYSPQTYNDGTLKIYKKMNVAEDGDMPDEQLILQDKLRYEEQTLGVTRYFAAMQNKKEVSRVVRCPRLEKLTTAGKDSPIAVLNDGSQYYIEFIQWPKEITPKSMDLTLVRSEHDYELA